ncbi:MAG: hypothetical protein KDC93_16160, partial [Cyclobacteriaceae bacterium]|nr:hypothetical protein [Cyclobacteriaceae bacterium]
MDKRVSISSQLASQPSPSIQFLVTFIAISKMEITTGKLKTAIRIVLLFALAAMLERSVSDDANPNEVNRINDEKIN